MATTDYSLFSPFNYQQGQWLATMPRLGDISSGESTMHRREIITSTVGMGASGHLRLTYFTAKKTETINNISAGCGNAAAGATPTLCRMGLYKEETNGDLTLVASCANDTTLFSATNTVYTKATTSSYIKVKGQRYAIGVLVVTAAALPQMYGNGQIFQTISFIDPKLMANVTGQTDLPSTIANGSLTNSGSAIYCTVTP